MTLVHRASFGLAVCGVRSKHTQTAAKSKRKCCHSLDAGQLQGEYKACQQCIGEYYLDLKTFSSSRDPALRSLFSRRCEERGRASHKQQPITQTLVIHRSASQNLISFHFCGRETTGGKRHCFKMWVSKPALLRDLTFVLKEKHNLGRNFSKACKKKCNKMLKYTTDIYTQPTTMVKW